MRGRSGVTADTNKHLMFDAGELYIGIDEEALKTDGLEAALTGATKVGGTRGGSTFNPGRTLREIEVDGALGPTKGFKRRSRVAPVLSTTLLEMSFENLKRMIAGAQVAQPTAEGYGVIEGGPVMDEDYLTNVALVTTYADTGEAVVCVVRNALVDEAPEIGTSDDDEATAAVEWAGHFDPEQPTREPWAIYHPGDL